MVVYIIFPWKLCLVALCLSPLIPLFLLRVVSAASCSASLPQLLQLKYPSKTFLTNYVYICICTHHNIPICEICMNVLVCLSVIKSIFCYRGKRPHCGLIAVFPLLNIIGENPWCEQ